MRSFVSRDYRRASGVVDLSPSVYVSTTLARLCSSSVLHTLISKLISLMRHQRIPIDKFAEAFSTTTELSSIALGGRVTSVSDEFFAEAFNLLLVEPAQSLKGQFGPKGALYSGWESRRHNPTYDWCIVKLGTSGTVIGFDIDTAHFNGNEAPQASVDALYTTSSEDPHVDDPDWLEILPKSNLGPNSRHLFKIPETACVNFVKLNMYPDGGIARFRVYGSVTPVFPASPAEAFDLAHVFAGGRVEFTSDQHFGVGSNLILPGRGKDMGDGWETKRSRQKDHMDWVIIKLGASGLLELVEIDTAHFKGNFPESCELHALHTTDNLDWKQEHDHQWISILPRTKLGPHRQHYFQLENVEGKEYTHVKLTIYPDGGIKRIRLIGRKSTGQGTSLQRTPQVLEVTEQSQGGSPLAATGTLSSQAILPVLPLTPEAFAPFGQVIQAYADHNAAPRGTRITPANGDSASKFHKLALLQSSYPPEAGGTSGLSVYRCKPPEDVTKDGITDLKVLERHPFTNQAFIPMGGGGPEGLEAPGDSYLVVVSQNGSDDRPDLKSLRAFVATSAQGIVYNTAVWHQPMTVLKKAMDFTCVETQIGNGDTADCEVVELSSVVKLRIPCMSNYGSRPST